MDRPIGQKSYAEQRQSEVEAWEKYKREYWGDRIDTPEMDAAFARTLRSIRSLPETA